MCITRPRIRYVKRGIWMRVRDPQALKRWRQRRHLSQRELAFLAKCSQNAIHLLESGQMATLSEDLALSIAHRLDVPWEDLFEARDSTNMSQATTAPQSSRHEAAS